MSELQTKLLEIKRQKDTYIIPENLRKNVEVFGITGTLESGSGTGDVKLFDTVEHMQADSTAQEGDLAIVYREEIQPVTEESEFDSCTFPNTVVLDEAFSDNVFGSFRAVDPSVMFDGMVDVSSSSFRFDGYGDTMVRVEYTSNDGITYTRTDGGEELQEFGTTIKWESMGGPFNSIIGNFMKIGGNYFEGLYEYKGYKNEEYAEAYSNVRYTNNDIVFNTTDVYISDLVELIHSKEEDIKSATGMSGEITDISIVKTAENQFTMYTFYDRSSYGQRAGGFILYNNNLYACGDNYTTNIYKFTINTSNNTVVYDGEINYDTTITINTYLRYCVLLDNVSPVFLICQSGGTTYRNQREIIYTSDNIGTNIKTYDIYTPTKGTMYEYKLTSTQLDATADYVYEKTFYGKNGIQLGNLNSNTINSANKRDILLNIADTMQTGYIIEDGINFSDYTGISIPFNLNTSSMTNMNSMFEGCFNLVIAPEMDTSNVTSMSHMFVYDNHLTSVPNWNTSNVLYTTEMFWDCYNLTSVPNWDLSNATILHGMFNGCTGLQNVPNFNTQNATSMINMFKECFSLVNAPNLVTNNVTSMYGMFNKCGKLVNVPDYNTINVTNLSYMFSYCSKLVNAPNFVTDNVIAISGMFNGCSNLVNVPQYNTAKVNSMGSMFAYCNNLTNASIQNIINMCLNSNITSQWYKDLNTNNSSSPLFRTKFTNSYYSNRLSELTTAGWTY